MITLLIELLVLIIFFGVLTYVVRMLALTPPLTNIAYAVVALIFVLVLLGMFTGYLPFRWSVR